MCGVEPKREVGRPCCFTFSATVVTVIEWVNFTSDSDFIRPEGPTSCQKNTLHKIGITEQRVEGGVGDGGTEDAGGEVDVNSSYTFL